MKHIEMTGRRFGRITVVAFARMSPSNRGRRWLCVCDCGKEKEIEGSMLRIGAISSCGCLAIERTKECNTSHGLSRYREHHIWRGMLSRCENESSKSYKYYGARGIAVCLEWHSFEVFLQDMGIAPDGLTIERIDNNKGYEPGNCKWATIKEQARNKRTARLIDAFGLSMCAPAWGERMGLPEYVIRDRIFKLKWAPERALSTPVKRQDFPSFEDAARNSLNQ